MIHKFYVFSLCNSNDGRVMCCEKDLRCVAPIIFLLCILTDFAMHSAVFVYVNVTHVQYAKHVISRMR